MIFLTLISYVAIVVQIIFITIAIGKRKWFLSSLEILKSSFSAAGLYYLAELVEEYTTIAKKCVWWMNSVSKHIIHTNESLISYYFIDNASTVRPFVDI